MVESSSTTIRIKELSFSIHGRLARWCNGAVGRTDCKRKDSAVTNDLTQLYWVMSASEFTLDINNPEEPKILCVGNNPDRQNIYGAALGLYNSQMDSLIPPSKISGLTQGMFVGSVSDNFNERIEQNIFHAVIVVDTEKVKREESRYQKLPIINDFLDADGNDCMKQTIQDNYNQIKEDVKQIVKDELGRIANDENLKHLIQKA